MDTYDNGVIRAVVPEGWKAFGGTDSEGKETPKKVLIYKNAEHPLDIFKKTGITVCFFSEKDFYLSPKWFYDNVVDIEPVQMGRYLWTGYTCTSLGYPYTMLEGRENSTVFQLMILMEIGEERISLWDSDVIQIVESICRSDSANV